MYRMFGSCLILILILVYSQAQPVELELKGSVRLPGGKVIRGVTPIIFLEGSAFPFSTTTLADPGGNFKFKRLEPGLYRLVVVVPKWGRMERTVQLTPSFADADGRVERQFEFQPEQNSDAGATVSVSQLNVPSSAWNALGNAEEKLGKRDSTGAVRELRKALKIAPNFSAAWNRLGTISYLEGRYEEAEGYFRRALEFDSESYSALVNLGAACLAVGKYEEALVRNLESVGRRPDDPLAHSQLGRTYFQLGKLEEAEAALSMARTLDPAHFSTPQLVLAEIYRRQSNFEAMADALEQFLQYHPDSSEAGRLRELLEKARQDSADTIP